MSFFVIGPIPALMIFICFCFSRTMSASKEPREFALITIPVLSVLISSEISFLNSCFISSKLLFII